MFSLPISAAQLQQTTLPCAVKSAKNTLSVSTLSVDGVIIL
jgi:hypothetical protein